MIYHGFTFFHLIFHEILPALCAAKGFVTLIDVDISPLFQLLTVTAKTTEAHGTLFHKRRHVLFILIFTRHQVLSLKLKNMISKNVGSFRVWATGNNTCTGTICSNSEHDM